MMRYLTVDEVIALHQLVIEQSGGSPGLRDFNGLDSSVAQPQMTYSGQDLYTGLPEKAAALAFSLVRNHAFVDGNKRIGHAAMEAFLVLNGWEIDATVDDQERMFLDLAAGNVPRHEVVAWIQSHARAR